MTALFMRWVLPRVAIAFAVASAPIAMSGVGAGAVAPLSAHVSPQSFEGTFTGSGVVLELHFDTASSRYLGSFSEGPQTAPVDLAPKGASLVGAYVSGAVPRTLVVTRVGDGLVIERGDHRSLLVRMRSDDRTSQRRDVTKALSAARVVAGGAASPLFQASGIEFPALPAQPQPAGQPAAQPVAQPAPVIPVIPVIPVAPPAAVPPFVRAGMRLTYQLGSSSSPRAGSNDGPTGAQSYQQVTITGIDNGIVATEVRSLARDVNARAVYNIQTDGYLLPIEQGTDYWMRPQKLAAMKDGTEGGQTVQRLAYPLDGTTYQAIRLTTPGTNGSTQFTYDLPSGLLLVWGSESIGADGVRHLANLRYLGMRQTGFPWTGRRADQTVLSLTRADWSGTYSVAIDSAYTSTYRLAQRWDVTRSDPLGVQARVTTQVDYGDGRSAEPTTKVITFPLSAVWIDPALLATLQKGQELDSDPITGLHTNVLGVQKGMLVLAETGAIQSAVTGYDLRTGLLLAVQLQQRHDPGTTTVFLQRTN